MTSLINTFSQILVKKVNKPHMLKPDLDVPISPSVFKSYHSASIRERELLHEYLDEVANQFSWFNVSYKPRSFHDHKLLNRINIKNSRNFLNYIGEKILTDDIKDAIKQVIDVKLILPPSFKNIQTELEETWGTGKRYKGCSYNSLINLIDALKVVEYLHQQKNEYTIDYRTLSVRLFSDSKRLEQLKGLISNLLKVDTPDLNDTKPESILAYWGVYRFPPLLQIKGDLKVKTTKGNFYTSNAWPFIGIPPDAIKMLTAASEPTYVLFIENKTTFERYCREIDDRGVIIYTNGFPSRRWHTIFKFLDNDISTSVSFFHWGDIDLGGFKILKFMTQLFKRPLYPHQMDILKKADIGTGLSVREILDVISDITHFEGLVKISSSLSTIKDEEISPIEQEILEIEPPQHIA